MDVAVDAAVRPVRSVGAGGHEAHVPPMGVVSGCREKQSMAHRPECDSARCAQGPGPRIEGDFNHNPLLFWTKSANIEAFGAVHSDKWPYQHPGSRKKRGLYEKFEGGFFGGVAGVVTTLMLGIAYISAISVQKSRGLSKKDRGLRIVSPRSASRLPGYDFRRRAPRRAMASRGCLSQAQRVPGRRAPAAPSARPPRAVEDSVRAILAAIL